VDSFCKSQEIEKTIAYAFDNVLLNFMKYYQRRSEGLLELILVFQGGFAYTILECFVYFLDDPSTVVHHKLI